MTDTLTHEYVDALVITKQRITSSKQREGIDHNTKRLSKQLITAVQWGYWRNKSIKRLRS